MRIRGVGTLMFAFVSCGLGACGNDGDGSREGQGAGGCDEACAVCGGDPCADCAATSARYRDEFESAVYACVTEGGDASCSAAWVNCFVAAEGEAMPRPIDDTYREACFAKRAACMAEGTSFADDDCLLSVVMEEAVVTAAQDCLTESCPETESCLGPLFE